MAFSFGNSASGGLNIQAGQDLEDIQTEALGFLSLAGEAKVQLLPTPWPTQDLPRATASLMSIASHKGLIAAAGPDVVVVATTQSVRKAFEGPSNGDSSFRSFQPQLTLPMPMKLSQLAFTSDETYLILSAAEGGGLAVYEVQALLQGSTESLFQMSTNGKALRALIPNPKAERGEFVAIVTNDGNLMMANLKEKNFVSGSNGQALKDGVSCISWSAQGKQLVAGLGNGTVVQMKPDGTDTGEIPSPPNLDGAHHVSSISWLENHVFLLVHTPSNFDSDSAPTSVFNIATRQPPLTFTFQRIADPSPPFGLNRSPPHHFFLRLRDFPPNLQDLIVVASTASTDIGLLSRSKVPLSGDKPAEKITGLFTMTEMSDDSRRAQLPMTSDLGDTSPIGMGLDLSSTEKVVRPIPRDEMDESTSPLPALMVLNNEGVLASWWIIYSESIRQGTTYPGLVVAEGGGDLTDAPISAQPSQSVFNTPSIQPAFNQSAFGAATNTSGIKPPAFATASKVTAFGAPGGLGKSQSPWGTPSNSVASSGAPVFGSTAFGTQSSSTQASTNNTPFGNTAFGAPAANSTPSSGPSFGTPAFGATSTPAFGSSGLSGNRPSVWGSAATAPSSGGFASFAQQGGFAAAAPSSTGSIFGGAPKPSSQPASANSVFENSKPSTSIFGASTGQQSNSVFGGGSGQIVNKQGASLGSGGFVLGSTFKADSTAQDNEINRKDDKEQSLFGGTFGSALGDLAKSPPTLTAISQETDMDDNDGPGGSKQEDLANPASTTPASTPALTKFTSVTPVSGSLFSSTSTTPPTVAPFVKPIPPTTSRLGNVPTNQLGSETSNESNAIAKKDYNVNTSDTAFNPVIKEEVRQESSTSIDKEIPEAPLPPDPISKASFNSRDPPEPSDAADAPLPPDFMPKAIPKPSQAASEPVERPLKTDISSELVPPKDIPAGPEEEDDGSEFLTEDENNQSPNGDEGDTEGSGEDVAEDLSPQSETRQIPGFTPQSSFGGGLTQIPAGSGLFNNLQKSTQPNPPRSLFGEIDRTAPVLPPPKLMASPRSPSPIRSALGRLQRPDTLRSVSAPGTASQLLGSHRIASKPAMPSQTLSFAKEQQKAEEERLAALQAKREAEESQALIDDEDEMVQKFLSSEITGTRNLDEFVAHSDYIGSATVDSIPAQIETVYRDINSMIDTLGINARALKSFIKGHTEQYRDEGRTRTDLEDDQDWVLVEIEDLGVMLEKDLATDLESGRVKDVTEKLESCGDLQKDLSRLRAKHEDVAKILFSRTDSNHMAIIRSQPLSAEQAAQQHDLRKQFMHFQELLTKAEEDLTVLKVGLASQTGNGNGKAMPTVEAVMRTITKMTSMAEKRSGDIDLLENQMRKLRFSSGASIGSSEGSPFATPQKKASLRNPGTSGTYGLFYTPDSSIRENSRTFRNSLMSSTGSHILGSPPRKKMSGFSADDKALLRMKLGRKKEVVDKLRAALQKAGTMVRLMDDDA